MHWVAWLGVSFAIFLAMLIFSTVIGILPYKRSRRLTPNKILLGGTFLSSAILLLPIYLEQLFDKKGFVEYAKSSMLSALHAIRLFAFDGGYTDSFESDVVRAISEPTQTLYSCFGAMLYIFAPMLTLKFVISLLRDVRARNRYIFSAEKHTHVFSELNEKSINLAKSIDKKYNKKSDNPEKYRLIRKELFVFCGVSDDILKTDLAEEAKEIGAIFFSKDMDAIRFTRAKKKPRKLSFYLISSDDDSNFKNAEGILENYDLPEASVRVFSSDIRAELLLAAKDVKNIKVIRINEPNSLIYHNLDVHGMRLFKNAREVDNSEKVISAVVIGLGTYGTEMIKALSWFCQMDGYRLKIKAFDKDVAARDRFSAICPALLDDTFNGKSIEGDAKCELDIIGGINVFGDSFAKAFSEITDASYVFVCLGSDLENLDASVKIRSLCERIKYSDSDRKPDIETVIYDSALSSLMSEKWQGDGSSENSLGVTNFKKEPYRIHMIGNLEEIYSVDTMLNSSLILAAEAQNTHYANCVYESEIDMASTLPAEQLKEKIALAEANRKENIQAFYKYEYNYRSSLSRIIHEKKSTELGCKSAEGEHRRWNAYMRSEGYQFSGSKDKASRNDLAKLHHNLVPFSELNKKEDVKKDS